MQRFAAVAALALLLLVSCGEEVGTGNGPVAGAGIGGGGTSSGSSFTYELTENACSTGKHVFNDKDSLCKGLQDDGANHFCARGLRADYFRSANCRGTFVASS